MIRHPGDDFGQISFFNQDNNGNDQVEVHGYGDSEGGTPGLVDELHLRKQQETPQPRAGRGTLGTVQGTEADGN